MSKPPLAAAVLLAAGSFAACAHRRAQLPASSASQAAAAAPAKPAEAPEPSVREDLMHAVPELAGVRFDYDSASLDAEARRTLKKDAVWLKAHAELNVQVAGYCDQRGTEEYNLALGQRRAEAVRHYYIRLGVPGRRVATISYGKDRLLCDMMDEACWARNRRADTLVALPKAVSQAPR